MPKLKTHSGAKKRFNLTKTGKVKRAKAYKSHILTKKDTKRTRRLRTGGYADATNVDAIRKMIPYKYVRIGGFLQWLESRADRKSVV